MPDTTRKETITRTADANFVHRKLLDAGGEFDYVTLRVEPLPRGAGEQFVNGSPGAPPEFVQAIGRKVREVSLASGALGNPVVDFRVTVLDVRFHEVDSDARAFSIAAEGAFLKALQAAGPIVLPQ